MDVLTSRTDYRGGQLQAPISERHNGVQIRRVRNPGFGRDSYLGRFVDYLCFFIPAFLRTLFGKRRDVVVFLTTPPLLSMLGPPLKLFRGQTYGIWSMDLHPDTEEALLFSGNPWFFTPLHGIKNASLRVADFVVDLGPFMKRRLGAKGVPENRLYTIPVWNKREEVRPVPDEQNPLIEELGLEDKFVVMYSGNAGYAHRFNEVKEAMRQLSGHQDIVFLFVGSGPRRAELEAFAQKEGIPNFQYRDYFSREQLAYSLSVADLHLITLKAPMAGIAAPGKLYGVLAAGRPALMVGPRDSEPGHTIEQHGVGTVVDYQEADDPVQEVTEAILTAYRRPDELREVGTRAREVFLEVFSDEVTLPQWEELLRSEAADGRRGT